MKVIADSKRRVVLPKPVESGDVFEILESGDRIVMLRLQKPAVLRPPTSASPLDPTVLNGVDLDEPAFSALSHEGVD